MENVRRYSSGSSSTNPLAESLQFEFSRKIAPNRFCKAATTERLSSWHPQDITSRGAPSSSLLRLYQKWSEGGMGVIITGNIMIDYHQLEAPGNLIIPRGCPSSGKHFEAFRELASVGKSNGALMIGQVNHPGRQAKATLVKDPVSASAVHLVDNVMGERFEKPHAASLEEIREIVEGFAHAAEFLDRAGFDGIQLHGAHGYLISQFLSPSTNLRTDSYGGPLAARSRLIFEIAQVIQARVSPNFILSIKVNCVEFQHDGFSLLDCTTLCSSLELHRFDFVELSGGTYEELAFNHKRESTRKREAFFLDFAEIIVQGLSKTKVYITGGFRTVGGMVGALETVDGIGMVRVLCQEPNLCKDILEGKVTGAIMQKIDADEIGLTSAAAGAQLMMMAKGLEPVNLGTDRGVALLMKALGRWMKGRENDKMGENSGWPEIDDAERVSETDVV